MFSYLWTKVALFFFSWPIFDVPASYKIFIVVTLACFVLCVMSFILVGCFSSLVLQGRDCLQLTMKKSLVSSFWSEKEDGPYTVMSLFFALLREPYIEIVLSPCHLSLIRTWSRQGIVPRGWVGPRLLWSHSALLRNTKPQDQQLIDDMKHCGHKKTRDIPVAGSICNMP